MDKKVILVIYKKKVAKKIMTKIDPATKLSKKVKLHNYNTKQNKELTITKN